MRCNVMCMLQLRMKTCRECNAINCLLGTLTSQIPWSLWDNLAPFLFFCLLLLDSRILGVMELYGFLLCFGATSAPISCLDLESTLTSPISSEKLALGVKPLVSFPFSTGGCFSKRLLFLMKLWRYILYHALHFVDCSNSWVRGIRPPLLRLCRWIWICILEYPQNLFQLVWNIEVVMQFLCTCRECNCSVHFHFLNESICVNGFWRSTIGY